jgi:murein DD-endopeptidase MepM/ murein hydrolase activator NlpD/peptidoglycan hydrolase-like protein with peptidoglycan-binding domain
MNSKEENENTSPSQANRNIVSPFLEEELFVKESGDEWKPRLAALEMEIPFRQVFEQGYQAYVEEQDFEEQFISEEEWDEMSDFTMKGDEDYEGPTQQQLGDEKELLTENLFLNEEPVSAQYPWTDIGEESAYPLEGDTYFDTEEPLQEEELLTKTKEFIRLLGSGAIVQHVQQRIREGVFGLSLLNRFAAGRVWNEDHLALEILFQRKPNLRPGQIESLSELKRVQSLNLLAVRYQRELASIREKIVRPIFGNPANFYIGTVDTCQINDMHEEIRKMGPLPGGKNQRGETWFKRDARLSPRKRTSINSIVLHHTAFNRGNDINTYKKVGAHYLVTADGQIAQLYNDLDFINASNGFNNRSVAIEFAGNFPDLNYRWWKPRDRKIPDRCYLTPVQIRAGRCLLVTLKRRLPDIKYLYAHRQSSGTRTNDPGPDVWFNIGEWALRELQLTDQLPATHIGTGKPIPESWRKARSTNFSKEVSDEGEDLSFKLETEESSLEPEEYSDEEESIPLEEESTLLETEALEESFLNEFDEEEDYVILEEELPPRLRVTERPRPIPESDPLPFASEPTHGSYWPIVTRHPKGREVSFLAEDGKEVGSWRDRAGNVRNGRRFLWARSGATRYHVAVDLWAHFNDPVVACQNGTIVRTYPFCCGDNKTSWALIVDHGNVVINYGEVAPDSLQRAGLRIGSSVRAGQLIGFIGRNPGGSSMLHFETYSPGTRQSKSWRQGQPRPSELLNPTRYLLFLAEFGLVGHPLTTMPITSTTQRSTFSSTQQPSELVRFAQRILNSTEGERLVEDNKLGPLTRGALERFRRKYNLGVEGLLDEKSQIAFVQRALEEIRRQSLFGQLGVLDESTRRELINFKSERGLDADATLDDATLKALADAVKSGTTSLSSPPITSEPGDRISVSPSISESVSPKLGKLVSQRNGRTVFEYNVTQDDLEWTAKLITGEASARDDLSTRAVIAALLNRFALFTNRVYPTFTAFIRAYSTPLQPVLRNKNVADWHYKNNRQNFQSVDGTYPGTNIPRGQLKRHLVLQRTPWKQLTNTARRIALEALTGRMPDTGIGLASEFASTWILYGRRVGNQNRTEAGWLNYTQNFKRDKGWRWIGHKPNLEQKRNAFFIDPRAANLPPGSVRVDKPSN